MYPGSNNQYPNYPNQQPAPGGAPVGFNVMQPGFNQSQGYAPQYVAGMPNPAGGQSYQAGQGQYYPPQQYGAANTGSTYNQSPGMYQNPSSFGGSYQPMNPSGYGVQNPPIGDPYNQQHFQASGNVGYPQMTAHPAQSGFMGSNQPMDQHHNLPQVNQTIVAPAVCYAGEVVRGTIKPHPNFNAEQDSNVLRTAMKGIGTDEKAIIECLGRRNLAQRLEIKKTFKTMFGKDLIDCLKSELSGDFRKAVIESLYDSEYYDAHSLNNAMEGAGTREAVLTEILTSRSNEEIENIKVLYKKHFNKDLEKHVISETSGFYKRVLVSCLQANKKELTGAELQKLREQGPSAVVNVNQASQEAAELYNAGEKKLGTDEAIFIKIFACRNKYQLRATFDAYEKLSGHNINRAIGNEMSGDLESALKAIALQNTNEPLYFANRLYKAMKGAGTNDSTLIRVILTRSEIDLDNIKREFQTQFNKSLTDFVREDTSGDYQKFLLRFVEGN